MSFWSIAEAILDIVYFLSNWRFTACMVAGLALAVLTGSSVSSPPLNWIAAGGVLIASLVIGWRWENAQE